MKSESVQNAPDVSAQPGIFKKFTNDWRSIDVCDKKIPRRRSL